MFCGLIFSELSSCPEGDSSLGALEVCQEFSFQSQPCRWEAPGWPACSLPEGPSA